MAAFHSDWHTVPKLALRKATRSSGKIFNERLADTIRKYWLSHGFDVYVKAVPLFDGENTYTLTSDLKNGLPDGATVGVPSVPV